MVKATVTNGINTRTRMIRPTAIRESSDQFRCSSETCGFLDRVIVTRTTGITHGDIVSNLQSHLLASLDGYVVIDTHGKRKVSVVLEQDCHRTSKIRQPQRFDIVSVDEYAPLSEVVYSSSKLENGAFSGSIRANYDLRNDVDAE